MSDKPFHNPFGVLAPRASRAPAAPDRAPAQAPPPAPAPAAPPARPGQRSIPRAVVRIERKGRGGKDVTIVEHLDLGPGDADAWLKALKAALGCGGALEDGRLVLQGDHRSRLPALLQARGVRKVTSG